ncbi:hypothetical protein CH330_04365 [candidate division WOR-3 bacterium JGI_Cruoil_03_51_56]|uniref:Glutamine amidotransferase domain-containing protein n=1 Tax=candidate division WOR-3 bacterium JGI_Cruoil_03_51_56 TaxID=1973747 RepID=A0A235BTW0_UNCW3|nr:MAG: hypothetical protein CH330_04365 [candidate division WOR-3 bacterium JGI_Cruoil_03_51_56]
MMARTLLVDCYHGKQKSKLGLYINLLQKFNREVTAVDYQELNSGYPVAAFDVVVISGSPMMLERDKPPAGIAEFLGKLKCPVLGICYGHQLLGKVSGGIVRCGKPVDGKELIRVIHPDSIFRGLLAKIKVSENHREFLEPGSVENNDWQILAESDSCPVEAMRHRRMPFYGVQFHPERSGPTGEKVLANFFGKG